MIMIIIYVFFTFSVQPKITVHLKPKTPTEGDDVTLSCNATGNPEPTISWSKNESPINTSNNFRIRFSEDKKQLTITNVKRTDSGEYRCVGNNSLGSDTSNVAALDVLCKHSVLFKLISLLFSSLVYVLFKKSEFCSSNIVVLRKLV